MPIAAIQGITNTCPDCHGSGEIDMCSRCLGRGMVRCTTCRGSGSVEASMPIAAIQGITRTCPNCGGSGEEICPRCGGSGV
jgi:DnaJ-class molecular chaperone